MPPHQKPTWQHTVDGLVLTTGHRAAPVPPSVARLLTGPDGTGTSADAAEHLLAVEGRLRRIAIDLTTRIQHAEHTITETRALAPVLQRSWVPRSRRRRRAAEADLNTVIEQHTTAVALLEETRDLHRMVRQFVLDLDAPTGLLAEAAAGWRRSPHVPATVVAFDDELAFLTDPRRGAASGWGGSLIAGEVFGERWRRDGDDDDPHAHPLDRAGPWQVGYLPRTREIYATRRCSYLPDQVWLLGTGFDQDHAHALLTDLRARMREPNSIVLAAQLVHTARPPGTASRPRQDPPARHSPAGPDTRAPCRATRRVAVAAAHEEVP